MKNTVTLSEDIKLPIHRDITTEDYYIRLDADVREIRVYISKKVSP